LATWFSLYCLRKSCA